MSTTIFIHPDLGLGGAERLVVDAAVGLQNRGHKVVIYTSHCDKGHCFEEVKDGTLNVVVRGNVCPPTLFGRFAILCAIIRQIHLILSLCVFTNDFKTLNPKYIIIDQLSAGVPLLRLLCGDTRILFYCHFPDKLLAKSGSGLLRLIKSLYRLPFNWLEFWSTSCSDDIVVNSAFTGLTVKSVFPRLRSRKLQIVYPSVEASATPPPHPLKISKTILLSINRFERKKDVALAVKAFAQLPPAVRSSALLIIAGGFDPRVPENASYLNELTTLCGELKLPQQTLHGLNDPSSIAADASVLFLPSIADSTKKALLDAASLLIYTPRNEHFGIVPLEAMLYGVPVLAANEGGPTETVVDGLTGWLRDGRNVEAWSKVMGDVLQAKKDGSGALTEMGKKGKERVVERFSKEKMASRLDAVLEAMLSKPRPSLTNWLVVQFLMYTFGTLVFAGITGWILSGLLFSMLDLSGVEGQA